MCFSLGGWGGGGVVAAGAHRTATGAPVRTASTTSVMARDAGGRVLRVLEEPDVGGGRRRGGCCWSTAPAIRSCAAPQPGHLVEVLGGGEHDERLAVQAGQGLRLGEHVEQHRLLVADVAESRGLALNAATWSAAGCGKVGAPGHRWPRPSRARLGSRASATAGHGVLAGEAGDGGVAGRDSRSPAAPGRRPGRGTGGRRSARRCLRWSVRRARTGRSRRRRRAAGAGRGPTRTPSSGCAASSLHPWPARS